MPLHTTTIRFTKTSVIGRKNVIVVDRCGQPQQQSFENKVEPSEQACANHLPSTNEHKVPSLGHVYTSGQGP